MGRLLLILLISMSLISGCVQSPDRDVTALEDELIVGGELDTYNIITDTETWCHYIEVVHYRPGAGWAIAVTPRLLPTGELYAKRR